MMSGSSWVQSEVLPKFVFVCLFVSLFFFFFMENSFLVKQAEFLLLAVFKKITCS